MVASTEAALVVACQNFLGECVLWDADAAEVVWIDIAAGEIWRYDPRTGATSKLTVGERIGAIGLRHEGGHVAGLASGFAFIDAADGAITRLTAVETDLPSTRLNDGRVDRQGRFICGGMDENLPRQPISAVYRLDPDRTVTPILTRIALANSTCFSPDGTTMYFTDMPTRKILAYAYDVDEGVPHSPTLFVDLADDPGNPDGSVIDADGCLWNAQFGGARVVRYDPTGRVDRVITVPVSNPTCCTLGGADYRTLYVTTARADLTDEELANEPDAGGLYAVELDVEGLPESIFAG
jgi:L-arabinonolactonase